ncbi:MAG: HPr family phosphocarrier protein [Eubacterium sp.]
MKTFKYVIKDKAGVHARPAGLLVKEATSYNSSIMIKKGNMAADGKRLLNIMSLGIKCGEEVEFTIEGEDETEAYSAIKSFVENNM